MKNINILDCTLRDGGYHNNWDFNKKLVNVYLRAISETKINYVELGFRTLDNKIKGETAYTTDAFINSLIIPKNLNIGVMVNASDFLDINLSQEKACKRLFPNNKNAKIKFVRLACHFNEIFKITNVIKWLKRNNFMVTINLMQISEIKYHEIKKITKLLKKLRIDVLYLADSLGSLKPKNIFKIINLFKTCWFGDMGIHAHNNMNLALQNSIEANKNGVKWIDSTVMGMGRGPGNVRTEDLMKYLIKERGQEIKVNLLKQLIKKYFLPLRKKYKWGPNKYYLIAGKNKIHPTYIQEILSDKRYKKLNYLKIINNLKKIDTRKYNPYKLFESVNVFTGAPKGLWSPDTMLKNKNVLIIGPGDSILKYKKSLRGFASKNNIFIICLNTADDIGSSLFKLRAACHPFRILSDALFHRNSRDNLVLPASMIPKNIYDKFKFKYKKIFDYGLSIKRKSSIIIKNNYCILPKPLTIGYAISLAISGKVNRIFLAGFDGYKTDNPHSDETDQFFKILQKKYKENVLTSLTPTKYNIKYKSIDTLKL